MEVFVGRQPIFDKNKTLFAYELLNRSGGVNFNNEIDGDKATAEVLVNSFFNIGIDKLANQKKCFINFTKNLLINDVPTFFPKDTIVVEILEDVEPDEHVFEALKRLKSNGYTIALDDYILTTEEHTPFLPYIDILKVDFLQSTVEERYKIIQKYKNAGIEFLAEKVETKEEFMQGIEMGYNYFQGYFFSKPDILSKRDLMGNTEKYLTILNEINKPNADIRKIANLIELDISLTYRLLKLINTVVYSTTNKIASVQQAIVLLGLKELKKWITVIMITSSKPQYSNEIVGLSFIRAKMAESIGRIKGEKFEEYFLFGMFSLVDTLLHQPMEEVLKELPLAEEIKQGLIGDSSKFSHVFTLIKALEQSDLDKISECCSLMNIEEEVIFTNYLAAIEWSNGITNDFSTKT